MAQNDRGRVTTYYLGKHFKTYHVLAYIIVSILVFGFFFIYQYLFVGEGSPLTTEMLAAIFAFLEVILMCAIYKGGAWLKKVYYYEVDNKGVTIVLNKNRTTYTYDKFTEVSMGMHSITVFCPVTYVYNGKKLMFSQYMANMWDMNLQVIDHIRDHVEIPDGLEKSLTAFSERN